jgi:hypothetical protein
LPTTCAATLRPSANVTCTDVTPLTMWALVTIRPSPSSTKPEPLEMLNSLPELVSNAPGAGCTVLARTATTPWATRS